MIAHYRAYFSEAYADLKRRIGEALVGVERRHADNAPAGFERAVRVAGERRQFWARFCDVPEVAIDTAAVVRDWQAAREAVRSALQAKQAAPLEATTLDREARNAVAAYETHRKRIADLSAALIASNDSIRVVKEQAAAANAEAIAADLARLRATRARHTPEITSSCDEYLAEKTAKARTEEERNRARKKLDDYRTNVFPGYQTAVNIYLQRFNAGFRLDSVTSASTRGGPACTYSVVINNSSVPVAGGTPSPGEPSFRNTLSSGDRDKPGGLVVDYIGLAQDLKAALANYTESGGAGRTALDQEEAVAVMLKKHEVCCGLFHGFDWSAWDTGTPQQRVSLLPAAQEHILAQEDGKERLIRAVRELSQAFALAVPHEEALRIRDDVAFFQAVQAVLAQLRVIVKRILRKHGYPPDKQEKATHTVLEQAEVLSQEWAVA